MVATTQEVNEPTRTCLGCRLKKPKSMLVRLVSSPNGYQVDEKSRVQSRGYYVCSDRCREKFNKRHKPKPNNRKELK